MKKLTAFLTITLLVCIATFVAFANHNRDVSYAYLVLADPDDDFPSMYSQKDGTGTDSEGPLYSTASSGFWYFRNDNDDNDDNDDNGDLMCGASAYAYVSCYPNHDKYETEYDLYAGVPSAFPVYPNVREPDTQTGFGTFYDSEYVSAEDDGTRHSIAGSEPKGKASATGEHPSNKAVNKTSSESPTPSNARDYEVIDD